MENLIFLSQVTEKDDDCCSDIAFCECTLKTEEKIQIIDITDTVEIAMRRAGFVGGDVSVQIEHTTARLWMNETEPLLHEDIKRLLQSILPNGFEFSHDNFAIRTVNMCEGECKNGESHAWATMFKESVLIHAFPDEDKNAKLTLGRWGRILLVELDGPRQERTFSIRMSGIFRKSS